MREQRRSLRGSKEPMIKDGQAKKKPKILLLTAYYKEEARSIPTSYNLARMFAESGFEVCVLTSKAISKRTDEPHENIRVYETRDIYIPDPINGNFMPFIFAELSRVIKKEKPDVAIISKYIWFPIITVPYLRLRKIPVVVVNDTYPGVVWFVRSRLVNFMIWLYYQTFGRVLVPMCDLVVLTHEEIIKPTLDLGVKRFKVIHNGIDLKRVDASRPSSLVKKKPGELVITFVGRLASIKGLDTLLEAARRIVEKHSNVRFVLVGGGDSSGLFHHNQIFYLGYQKDVLGILKKSDVLVMPSISEGLPSAVIEAMACRLPVVASDIPGGLRILVRDKKTGLLFRKSDPADLEKKLEALIKSPGLRGQLGSAAREHVKKSFSREHSLAGWSEALKGLIKRR